MSVSLGKKVGLRPRDRKHVTSHVTGNKSWYGLQELVLTGRDGRESSLHECFKVQASLDRPCGKGLSFKLTTCAMKSLPRGTKLQLSRVFFSSLSPALCLTFR